MEVEGARSGSHRRAHPIWYVLDESLLVDVAAKAKALAEGGDNHASHGFFKALRTLTRERGIFLIVDEVQTGVGKLVPEACPLKQAEKECRSNWNVLGSRKMGPQAPARLCHLQVRLSPLTTLLSMIELLSGRCSKKMQAAGFYHKASTRASAPYRNYNTWSVTDLTSLPLSRLWC